MTVPHEHIMQFFRYEHLQPPLQDVSRPICELARSVEQQLPRNPERTVSLRKLLECKDAAVRSFRSTARYDEPALDELLEGFDYTQLPPDLQRAAMPFCELVRRLLPQLPPNRGRAKAIDKLLEAKDAAVRALIAGPTVHEQRDRQVITPADVGDAAAVLGKPDAT